MSYAAHVTLFCPDRTGLVAAVAGTLFELGADLGDTSFAVLGEGAEFAAVCTLPDDVPVEAVEAALRALPELAGAEIGVRRYALGPEHGPSGEVTHRITVFGGDQPGLIARICETFVQFGANLVTLNSGRALGRGGHYVMRISVSIPPEVADACLATVANTAESLHLSCEAEAV